MGRVWLCAGAVALAMLAGARGVHAQSERPYPAKPIHILVGFSAGGAIDIVARMIGQKISEDLGQPAVTAAARRRAC
jgi:tripartite-type tricarboxylate transporter receptor subunit TctC